MTCIVLNMLLMKVRKGQVLRSEVKKGTYSILLEKQKNKNNNNEKLLLKIFFNSPEILTENKEALKCLGV